MHVCSYPYFMKIAVLNPFHAEATFVHGRNYSFEILLNPAMLVFIGKLMLSIIR